ncbi:hypothetical protein ACERII_13080 [Evansella sp. AB-rgal1]
MSAVISYFLITSIIFIVLWNVISVILNVSSDLGIITALIITIII